MNMTPACTLLSRAADLDRSLLYITKYNLGGLIMECTHQHRPMSTTLYKFQAEFLKLRRKSHQTGRPWNEWNM